MFCISIANEEQNLAQYMLSMAGIKFKFAQNNKKCDFLLINNGIFGDKINVEASIILANSNWLKEIKNYNICGNVISYGLNEKDCITASSIGDNDMQICIQRSISFANGKTCVPQEIKVPLNKDYNTELQIGIHSIIILAKMLQ